MEQLYTTLKELAVSGGDLSFFQNFFVRFYQAFIEADRWLQYLNGVKTTLIVTALALIMGVCLGLLVSLIRTAHDQQRPGKKNPILGVLNMALVHQIGDMDRYRGAGDIQFVSNGLLGDHGVCFNQLENLAFALGHLITSCKN